MTHRLARMVALCVMAGIILLGAAGFPFTPLAHGAPAITAAQIDDYLRGKSSPLAGQGQALIDSGRTHDVDPRLLIAIAGAESTFGLRVCADYNAWNWFYASTASCSANPFSSWTEGIESVASGLRRLYLDQGRTTIPQIAGIYTATERDIWIRNVTLFYHTELGGDLDDLTFSEEIPLAPGPAVTEAAPQAPPTAPAQGEEVSEPEPASASPILSWLGTVGQGSSPFGMGTFIADRLPERTTRAVSMVTEMGVGWARETFTWWAMEKCPGKLCYYDQDNPDGTCSVDCAPYDRVVQALNEHDVQIVGLVRGRSPHYTEKAIVEDWLPEWREFVRQIVRHYKGQIHYWQIENEQNVLNEYGWLGVEPSATQVDPEAYVALLRAASEAAHEADPGVKIVLGGVVLRETRGGDLNPLEYLQAIADAGGWAYFDIVAVHLYRSEWNPEQPLSPDGHMGKMVDEAEAFYDLVQSLGPKPIWVTEMGWDTHDLQERAGWRDVDPAILQSDYLIRGYVPLIASGYVERVIWYDFRDDTTGKPNQDSFGLVERDLDPKPAYYAFQTMADLLSGSRFQEQVRGQQDHGLPEDDDVYEYRFAKGTRTIIVLWKARGGDVPLDVVVENMDANVARIIGPDFGAASPEGKQVEVVDGTITVSLTERPVFVVFGPPKPADAIAAWFQEQWRDAQQALEDWWAEQQDDLERRFKEWREEQEQKLMAALESELERLVRQTCGAPAGSMAGLALVFYVSRKKSGGKNQ